MIPWVQRPIIYDIRARCYCLTYSVLGKAHVGSTGRRTCLPSLDPRISRMLTLPSGFSSGVLICNTDYTDWVTISKEHVSREEIEDDDDKQHLRPKPDALPEIYTTLGQDYDDRVNLM